MFVVCCVDSGLCDGLITGSEDTHAACVCLIMCDLINLNEAQRGKKTPNSLPDKTKITIAFPNMPHNSNEILRSSVKFFYTKKWQYIPLVSFTARKFLKSGKFGITFVLVTSVFVTRNNQICLWILIISFYFINVKA